MVRERGGDREQKGFCECVQRCRLIGAPTGANLGGVESESDGEAAEHLVCVRTGYDVRQLIKETASDENILVLSKEVQS